MRDDPILEELLEQECPEPSAEPESLKPTRCRRGSFRTALLAGAALLFANLLCTYAPQPSPQATPPMVQPVRQEQDIRGEEAQASAKAAPILMYHKIGPEEDRFTVSPLRLWSHLDHLRENKYSLLTFEEYAERTRAERPAVLTFDDGTQDQFNLLPDGSIDPDSAIGVLERYRHAYPGYRVTATFFINATTLKNKEPFEQEGKAPGKLQFLRDRGYEIAAHGTLHRDFSDLSKEEIRDDCRQFLDTMDAYLPGYRPRSFAYPYGHIPSEQKQQVVEAFFPYTAHAWGGVAVRDGISRVPRIEIGPLSKLQKYTSSLSTDPSRWGVWDDTGL